MTILLLLGLGLAVAVLLGQVSQLRTETQAANRQVAGEVARIAAEHRQSLGSLARVADALEAAPAAANQLSAPDALPRLTEGLKEIAAEFRGARDEMRSSATSVCKALERATGDYAAAAEQFETRGTRLARTLSAAAGEMERVTGALHEATGRSAELHDTLRASAVSFQMVQDLIGTLDQLLPQVAASAQALARLIDRVEEKNLFSEQVFSRFESSLGELSGAVMDLAALSRTFTEQLDQNPARVAVG